VAGIPDLYNPPGQLSQINPNGPAVQQAKLRHWLAQNLSEPKLAPYGPSPVQAIRRHSCQPLGGAPTHEIMAQGRWKTARMVEVYTRSGEAGRAAKWLA